MKALVIGGAGFIGSNLVEELVKRKFEVVVYDDFSTGSMSNFAAIKDKIRIVKADIRSYPELRAAAKDCSVVFHLAAQVGNALSLENPHESMEINAGGTINVVNACRENKIKSLVYSSSCAIFGETRYTPVDEKHPLNPVSPYGVTKLAGEQICIALGSYHDIKVCCLRYFNVYGKNQRFNPYGNVLPIFAERVKRGKELIVYGDGNQTRDFIDVRDVVSANILAFERQASGVYNIGTGKASTVSELVKCVKDASGKEIKPVNKPPRAGEVRDSVADISKARKELCFSPKVTLKQGVRDYFEWFAKNF